MADEEAGAQRSAAAKQRGAAFLDQVIVKAAEGRDPFQLEPPKARGPDAAAAAAAAQEDPDVVAFGRFFERHCAHLIMAAFMAAQAFSWVLMKGSVLSMKTPAVLTFLHLLAATALHLIAVAYNLLPSPQLTSVTLRGALVHVPLSTCQLLLSMAALLHCHVYMLLCCLVLAPLLGTHLLRVLLQAPRPPPAALTAPLALAVAGAGLEILADTHKSVGVLVLLLLYALVVLAGEVWQLLKSDATLGGRLTEPELVFRVREISDAEEISPPATASLLQHTLLAAPVLLLGFLCQEGRDLVEHEPSVPALSIMLLSGAAYAVACVARVLLQQQGANQHTLAALTTAAALLAMLLDFTERAHALGLLGVTCCVLGALWYQLASWDEMSGGSGPPPLLLLPTALQHHLHSLQASVGTAAPKIAVT